MGHIAPARTARPGKKRGVSIIRILALSLVGAAALIGGYWYVELRPRMEALSAEGYGRAGKPSREKTIELDRSAGLFDLAGKLPIDPMGAAISGDEWLIAQRSAPGGFLRMKRSGPDGFVARHVPIIESYYLQKVGFEFVAWGGKQWIAYARGSWFQRPDDQYYFVTLAPETLEIVDLIEAPPLLGCLAWDGVRFWAATRKNTPDSGEDAWLYELDQDFSVVERHPSTGQGGCQGMAWDGERLWIADVFADTIETFDVSGASPRLVHSRDTGVGYLSGLVWEGESIWITEYDTDTIRRIRSEEQIAWSGGAGSSAIALAGAGGVPMTGGSADPEEISRLQRDLRDDHWATRMRAEQRLRELGMPVGFDREQNSFAVDIEDMEAADMSAEVRDDSILASWDIWFAHHLFEENRASSDSMISIPVFRRFTITVEGGTLSAPLERVLDATPGHNVRRDVVIANGLGQGEYTISCFMHVQYIDRNGTSMILNESALPLSVQK